MSSPRAGRALAVRERLAVLARWLAPSAGAACLGAIVAGGVDAWGAPSLLAGAAIVGFVALAAVPLAFVAAVIARAVWRAWQPAALVGGVTDAGGGAPRLAAWLALVSGGVAAFAWLVYEATWVLSRAIDFTPVGMGLGEPLVVVGAALVVLALAGPALRVLVRGARALDARVTLTPRRIVAAALALVAAALAVAWLAVRGRIGPLDLALHAPIAGALTVAAAHVRVVRVGRARRWIGAGAAVIAAAAIAAAVFVRVRQPALALEIWGEDPIAGLVVDAVFDVDAIREGLPTGSFLPAAVPGEAHPDVVLITIDAVRADHTPPYGGSADMPTLKWLAERGAVFEWAFSPSNVTRRSIPSMATGLAPNRVHGRVVGWALRVDPRHVLVAERLRAAGYDTAGFMCCESFWGPGAHTGLSRGLSHVETDHEGPRLAKRARDWLLARAAQPNHKPLFLWMHILEPHNWTASGEPPDAAGKKRQYDASLAAADRMLADVVAGFGERLPIIIVTADHGEGLGDHGHPYHSTDLYVSQTRVPLVIAGPGIDGRRVSETVSLVDLTPTILALAGFAPPTGHDIDGASFADLATGKRAPDPDGGVAFSAMIKDRSNPGGQTAIARGKWHLIRHGPLLELYDTRADPGELHDRLADEPEVVRALLDLLAARERAGDASPFVEAQ